MPRTGAAIACEAFFEAGDATDAAGGLTSKSSKSDSSAPRKGEGQEGIGDRCVGSWTGESGRMDTWILGSSTKPWPAASAQ